MFRIEDLQTADVAMKKQEEVKRGEEVKSEFVQSKMHFSLIEQLS